MGPLKGLQIIEMAGIGPAPFCGMVLSDLGANVIRVDRVTSAGSVSRQEASNRGKKSIAVDLKTTKGIEVVLNLVEASDALFEGFRPGVMEKLGLGPDVCLQKNKKIVFGRMTGWGQEGPLAFAAGHDINYISLSGVLATIGRPGSPPVPPLNLIGDYGGGGMLLALGLVAALFETKSSGKGQVIDAAMVDGSALLMTMIYTMRGMGLWKDSLGSNFLDGGAHFYDTYECKDGKYISIASIEPKFYQLLREITPLEDSIFDDQLSRESWPEQKKALKEIFLKKTQQEWCGLMEGTDICFAPVLNMAEAPEHPHNKARNTFIELEGIVQPAPAPRFSRTVPEVYPAPAYVGEHTEEVLKSIGMQDSDIEDLKASGEVA
jgi:alpha-methylacyl-CoA racemase